MLAWSVWQSNIRFLYSREIRSGVTGTVEKINPVPAKGMDGYSDAWYPSLSIDSAGQSWGAWNQHYPSVLGVCSGDLTSTPISVTRLEEDMDLSENGGYPSALTDGTGKRWVFYETFAWDVYNSDASQKIKATCFDPGSGTWTIPSILTMDRVQMMNQTPVGTLTGDGKILVVWSGREIMSGQSWRLYASWFGGGRWSLPVALTDGTLPARAPKIISDRGNRIWIAYHEGTGDNMRIKVMETTIEKITEQERK
jgi:hypothetical protein